MTTIDSFDQHEWLSIYDSAETDIIDELINPLLSLSVSYLRGVAFFSSSWLRLAAPGLAALVKNGGKARIIMSPVISEADWEAMHYGQRSRFDEELRAVLRRNLDSLRDELRDDTLNTFAWLIADELIAIKFAIPRHRAATSDYHDKAAVFTDATGKRVAIHGSFNDSYKATKNGEALSVFFSWKAVVDEYAYFHEKRLEELWRDENAQFTSIDIPEDFKSEILSLRNTENPPYSTPKLRKRAVRRRSSVCFPATPRDYQLEAVGEWEKAGCRGLFEMATGTGKTITSLTAAVRQWEERGRLALVVAVPYLHLMEQWREVMEKCRWRPILASGNNRNWHIEVANAAVDFKLGALNKLGVIITHDSAADGRLERALTRIPSERLMFIADEAHGLGAAGKRAALLSNAELRLGLSATPHRWYDANGTEKLFDYFGEICYSLPIEDAINKKFLTPYDYHPIIVNLDADEGAAFSDLTAKIARFVSMQANGQDVGEQLKKALLERSRIINACAEKLPALERLLGELTGKSDAPVQDLLVYCADGMLREPLSRVARCNLRCHQFTCNENMRERQTLIEDFAEGRLQALVSMRCLDEGVDIPTARTAVFLASATNPRQFIQRRGRVLRKADKKTHAVLYDFLVFPGRDMRANPGNGVRALLGREMPRFAEYASCCRNEFEARGVVRDELNSLGMLHLLDERPWITRANMSDEAFVAPDDE